MYRRVSSGREPWLRGYKPLRRMQFNEEVRTSVGRAALRRHESIPRVRLARLLSYGQGAVNAAVYVSLRPMIRVSGRASERWLVRTS